MKSARIILKIHNDKYVFGIYPDLKNVIDDAKKLCNKQGVFETFDIVTSKGNIVYSFSRTNGTSSEVEEFNKIGYGEMLEFSAGRISAKDMLDIYNTNFNDIGHYHIIPCSVCGYYHRSCYSNGSYDYKGTQINDICNECQSLLDIGFDTSHIEKYPFDYEALVINDEEDAPF